MLKTKRIYKESNGFGHVEFLFGLLVVGIIALVGYSIAGHHTAAGASAQSPTSSEVYVWGSYIGGKSSEQHLTPSPVANTVGIVSIDAGNSSSYALQCTGGKSDCSSDGTVLAWGNDNNGQLGNGTVSTAKGAWLTNPVQVQFPAGTHIVAIGEAKNNGYAIDSTGQAWGWGLNQQGSLCIGNSQQQPTPVKISAITQAVAVQGGEDHVLWLLANNVVEACGINTNGQLGNGSTKNSATPVIVNGLSNIVQISAGNRSSAAVDNEGNLYMWGDNIYGRLGIGSTSSLETVPTKVTLPAPVQQVSAGGSENNNGSTVALLNNNSVYAWGNDTWGQLGDGGTTNQKSPVEVQVPAGTTFTEVIAGGSTSYGLDSSGNVWSWGLGSNGRLGNGKSGTSNIAYQPIKVDSGVDMISATASNAMDHHVAQ